MRERLKQYAATAVVAALMFGAWWLVAHVAEKPAPPSYTPTGCEEGDRQCAEWIDVQKEER